MAALFSSRKNIGQADLFFILPWHARHGFSIVAFGQYQQYGHKLLPLTIAETFSKGFQILASCSDRHTIGLGMVLSPSCDVRKTCCPGFGVSCLIIQSKKTKEKAIMGAAAPKPPLAIPPHSKLWASWLFPVKKCPYPVCDRKNLWYIPIRSSHRLHVPGNTIADSESISDLLHGLSDNRDKSFWERMLILFRDYAYDYLSFFEDLGYNPDVEVLGWGGMYQFIMIRKTS